MPHSRRPGEELGGRYRLVDLLNESSGGRFWRAYDRVLSRHVAVHVIPADDGRAEELLAAARSSAGVQDRRMLRVLDAERDDDQVYVVHEWGAGTSLDRVLEHGPLGPRRAAWMVAEVAEAVAAAHAAGIAHGRLAPENVLIDHGGHVRLIGLAVDAALHGLPFDRVDLDLTDLGGLLYAGLTGRWAGASRSSVAVAPREDGRVLRPRRVRAGVPRLLDRLCDQLLDDGAATGSGAAAASGPASAQEVAALLHDFVGDPIGMAAALAGALGPAPQRPAAPPTPGDGSPVSAGPPIGAALDEPTLVVDRSATSATPSLDQPTRVVPLAPELVAEPEREAEPEPEQEPEPAGHPRADLPTEAGVPIFRDDDEEVEWLRARTEKPPPPPPFEDPPERPLFAPDPPPGQPVRRPRPGAAATATSARYWPWEETGASGPATGGAHALDDPATDAGPVPGRRTLRLALVLGLVVIIGLAVVFAFGLGRGTSPLGLGEEPDPPEETSQEPAPLRPVRGLAASDLDPQGNGEENPEVVDLAVDGDPATAWRTLTYEQQLGPGGLKTGLGLVVDLGTAVAPREVTVAPRGGTTAAELYLTEERPSDVAGLEPLGRASGDQQLRWELPGEATGRYLVIWLVELPAVGDGFRGEVADVVVRR